MTMIQQKSFIFDLDKCTGCGACQLACAIENEVDLQNSWRSIYTFNEFNFPEIPQYHFSLACNHCIDPPCLTYCPAFAYKKDENTGAVVLDQNKCIGCKYCSWVCPYDAPKFNLKHRVMEKCTFCDHRLKEGFDPACVALCPTTALQLGKYQEKNSSDNIPGFTKTLIKPAIRFMKKKNTPESSIKSEMNKEDILASLKIPDAKIDLPKEWPLMVFSLLAALIIGWYSTTIFYQTVNPYLILAIGTVALLISSFHLGKFSRAFRAVLNVKNSWLSREILFFILFLIFVSIDEFILSSNINVKRFIVILGLACLLSIDQVYVVLPKKTQIFHSATVVVTGFLFFSYFANQKEIFIGVLILKIILYSLRRISFRERSVSNPIIFMSRWIIGFLFGLMFGTSEEPSLRILAFFCLILGEIIDRCEFYSELRIITPQRQINDDLLHEIQS